MGRKAATHAWIALASPANLATAVTLLLVYLGLEWISFIHEHKGVPVTPWNPGIGAAFAILVREGARFGIALFLGVLIAEIFILRTALPGWTIVAIATVMSASFATAAAMVQRYLGMSLALDNVRHVLVLLASGAAAATISAILISLLLIATDDLTVRDLAHSSIPLLVGDIIGIAVMTPLVLRLWSRGADAIRRNLPSLIPELIVFALLIGAILWLIVGADTPNTYKFLSFLFLPVVGAALRYGIDGSCCALAATQLGLVIFLHQQGYDAVSFTEFQIVMLALTTSGLLVGVVVSERQRADQAARSAKAHLEELQAEAAQAARISMASGMASALAHEINQPMTAARALARSTLQVIDTPPMDTERARTILARLIAHIDHAAQVVRRMREFVRRGEPHFSTLDIKTVLEDVIALARYSAPIQNTKIELAVSEGLPTVFGDRTQLQQVALNLVHNAAEAIADSGRDDGRILISAQQSLSEPTIEVSVTDNGVGVPAGRALFEPVSSRKERGMGLGLSICASIVQVHGGRIWLHSTGPEGSEFRFSLPLQEHRAA
jgi:C4-dicarboxylate-specific signal transduction histidine kinase